MKKVIANRIIKNKEWVVLDGKAKCGELVTARDDGRVVVVRVKHGERWPIGKVVEGE